MVGILVLGALLGGGAVALSRRSAVAVMVVLGAALLWPFVHSERLAGPVVLRITEGHGVHASDFLGLAVLAAVWVRWGAGRRPS